MKQYAGIDVSLELTPSRWGRRLAVVTDRIWMDLLCQRGPAFVRPPCHRSPDEALYEAQADGRATRSGGQGGVQRGHGRRVLNR